ncbi:MAG: hypothetical protein VBE63_11675 [Lamprobacter sp.]|uniref:hypothetical protein n=1 Tax=Lamprobacter sp. TaxID=3100796 RepID=UPI002B264366|nr:hypothetical protein [Lamprobacter sp.]MEA3640586.1 hypothetical protein [Lamprobacter sp.]
MQFPRTNKSEQTVTIDFRALTRRKVISRRSPIDDYYDHRSTLLANSLPTATTPDPTLLQALLLGVISSTEYFFRDILARLVRICPFSRSTSSNQVLSLGAVDYCGLEHLGFGLMENTSFADPKTISQATQKFLGLTWNNGSSVASAIAEFGKICQIRHAIVHSRGHLGDRNARELGLALRELHELCLSLIGFQDLLLVCDNVVRAYNRFIFEKTVERWINTGKLVGDWSNDKEAWCQLFSCCYSTTDAEGTPRPYQAWRKIKSEAKASATAQGFI